jgi:hypothetical protein
MSSNYSGSGAESGAERLAALERLDEDLFDFPDIEGMHDMLAASRADAADSVLPTSAQAAALDREPKAPLPSQRRNVAKGADRRDGAPRNAEDLDEDLFSFSELLDLGAGSEHGADDAPVAPRPTAPRPTEERAAEAPPRSARKEPAVESAAQPVAPPTGETSKPEKAREPRKQAETASRTPAREKEATDSRPSPTSGAAPGVVEPVRARRRERPAAPETTTAPLFPFPTSIDLPPARSKLLWVLVGCFLLVNGGVFLMTQQQNQNVNATLVAVTSTLAEAVARGSQAAPREVAPIRDSPTSDVVSARSSVPMLDPADFSNSNELGLNNARRLIEQGAYAEARRNLFFILANQDRSTPLTPALREDVDYLIALTYYDQGRSIGVEEAR